jgi:hypothetical protein
MGLQSPAFKNKTIQSNISAVAEKIKPVKDLPPARLIDSKVIDALDNHLRHTPWFAKRDATGIICTFPGAKSGNRTYAGRLRERLENALGDLHMDAGDCLFITLTATYSVGDIKSIFDSWKKNRGQLPAFLQRLRRLGFRSYIWCREAHAGGGCHVHLIAKRKGITFRSWTDGEGKDRLDDEGLRAEIEAAWEIGFVDIQVITSDQAGGYLSKELGKSSHIEDALDRAKAGAATDSDTKKLWACYLAARLKIRRWGVSRNLIKHMINPSEEEEAPEPCEYIMLPKRIRDAEWFPPVTGPVDPSSYAFYEISRLFDRRQEIEMNVRDHLKACELVPG